MQYVEIVNWGATRRHYATQAQAEALGRRAEGRLAGLCGKVWGCHTLAGDKLMRERFANLPERDYAALPLCKFCERKATP